ncbi:MAG: phage Gp37/Gp68 family protein [Candidatus Marinimicrobia bacterium]|nr:phage Gp37/Gp68 family protein [Candidatus Neomarinimicrobiota bacterium]
MSVLSSIEWTEATWNPVTGCTKVSPGCKHCYAERMAGRLEAMGQYRYRNGFKLTLQEDLVGLPLTWKKPKMIFVNSMSDLFHKDVPLTYIQDVFDTMNLASWHIFQILTKRSERLRAVSDKLIWGDNIWMGVSVENRDYEYRINDLRQTGARVKFLSLEPLLGSLRKVSFEGMDWLIVGGESGPGARPMKKSWVTEIRDRSRDLGISFFFKQWGGVNKKKTGRELEGQTYDQFPAVDSLGVVQAL